MPRLHAFPVLLLASACQSTGPKPDVTATPVTTQIGLSTGGNIALRQTAEHVGISTDLRIPPDSAYLLLQAVYADLQLAVRRADATTRVVAVSAVKIRRRLGGVALTRYLDCGWKDNLPNAETYDIELSMTSHVAANPDNTSRVTTRVQAVASDPLHGAANVTSCTTLGALETRIADAVRQKAGLR